MIQRIEFLEANRQEMINYLVNKKFTRKAAELAINNYIETKKFLIEELSNVPL